MFAAILMNWRCWLLVPLLLAPLACEPEKEDLIQLQRDIALLEDQVRTMRGAFEDRTKVMPALLQESLRRLEEVQTATRAIDSALNEQLRQREVDSGRQAAKFGSRMDEMTSGLRSMRDQMADLNARLKQMEQTLAEIDNAVRETGRPPVPPVP